ncbi:hypothetical protein [Georgenia yuyongxinii]|nr:hypothetical protein [Georgenia yuyongxinii]
MTDTIRDWAATAAFLAAVFGLVAAAAVKPMLTRSNVSPSATVVAEQTP